ncbi:GIY-YIG nuclease family protein [Klebsiella aerogenes]
MTLIEEWLQDPPISEDLEFPEGYSPGGWVYVLENEAMPGLYKVGMTTSSPEKRAAELSGGTGVPKKFHVVKAFRTKHPALHEAEIHRLLARYRVNDGREFFKCKAEKIISICKSIIPDGDAETVSDLVDKYNLITFEKFTDLEMSDVLSQMGITHFGDSEAAIIRLAMFGSEVVRHLTRNGGAVVFFDAQFTLLTPGDNDG